MGEFDCEPGCEFGGEGEQEPPAREPPHRGFAGGDGVVDTGFCVVGRVAGVDGRSQPPDFRVVETTIGLAVVAPQEKDLLVVDRGADVMNDENGLELDPQAAGGDVVADQPP